MDTGNKAIFTTDNIRIPEGGSYTYESEILIEHEILRGLHCILHIWGLFY